jgi:hypothetical protein
MTDADWLEMASKEGGGGDGPKGARPSEKVVSSGALGPPVAAAVGPPPGFEGMSRTGGFDVV